MPQICYNDAGELAVAYESWIDGFLDDYENWAKPDRVTPATQELANLFMGINEASPADVDICVTPIWFCFVLAKASSMFVMVYTHMYTCTHIIL